jgi:hypothetical protein
MCSPTRAFGGLDLDDYSAFYEDVRVVVADDGAILVPNQKAMLLLHLEALLAKPIHQRVLVYLLEKPWSEVSMRLEGRLTDQSTQVPMQEPLRFVHACLLDLQCLRRVQWLRQPEPNTNHRHSSRVAPVALCEWRFSGIARFDSLASTLDLRGAAFEKM